jgi:sulfatase maturation enzyme AslB (radical SAM superfamily)
MKKVLLLNTLTSAGIVLEESQFETLRIGKYDSLPDDLFIKLIENGFLVSPQREEDENATYWRFYHNVKSRSVFGTFHLVVIPKALGRVVRKPQVPKNLNERLKTLEIVWGSMVKLIENPKFLLRSHKLSFSLCDAKVADSLIVGSGGSIYSCYSLIGTDAGKIGNIETGFNS